MRLRPKHAAAAAAATLGVLVAAALIAGASVPGPPIREWLGLAETKDPNCDPAPELVHSPPTPGASAGHWRAEPASPLRRAEVEGVALGERIYLLGGQASGRSLADVVSFDSSTRSYARAPALPRPLDHVVGVGHGDHVYAVGGWSGGELSGGFWRWAPGERGWTELAPLRTPRGGHGGAVIGDRLYVVGGSPPAFPDEYVEPYRSLEIYDFKSGRWQAGPDMPTARHHLSVAALDGKLYAVGGHSPEDFAMTVAERFDPQTRRWERLPDLPLGGRGAEAVAVGGELVVIAGDDESEEPGWVTPAAFAFDPRRDSWRRLPDLRTARHGHAAAVLGGRVYVFEGSNCPGFNPVPSAESLPLAR